MTGYYEVEDDSLITLYAVLVRYLKGKDDEQINKDARYELERIQQELHLRGKLPGNKI